MNDASAQPAQHECQCLLFWKICWFIFSFGRREVEPLLAARISVLLTRRQPALVPSAAQQLLP